MKAVWLLTALAGMAQGADTTFLLEARDLTQNIPAVSCALTPRSSAVPPS